MTLKDILDNIPITNVDIEILKQIQSVKESDIGKFKFILAENNVNGVAFQRSDLEVIDVGHADKIITIGKYEY